MTSVSVFLCNGWLCALGRARKWAGIKSFLSGFQLIGASLKWAIARRTVSDRYVHHVPGVRYGCLAAAAWNQRGTGSNCRLYVTQTPRPRLDLPLLIRAARYSTGVRFDDCI